MRFPWRPVTGIEKTHSPHIPSAPIEPGSSSFLPGSRRTSPAFFEGIGRGIPGAPASAQALLDPESPAFASAQARPRDGRQRPARSWHSQRDRAHKGGEAGGREGRELARQRTGKRAFECARPSTLKGKRDRAILAHLIGCGLRRAELVGLEVAAPSSASDDGSFRISAGEIACARLPFPVR